MDWLEVSNAFSLEIATNLQQSITDIHRSLRNIWLFLTGIYYPFFPFLYYTSALLNMLFPEEMFLAFFRKMASFSSNNMFDCSLSAGVSILRLSQRFHPANAHGTREQVFLPGVAHLSGEVRFVSESFFKGCLRSRITQEARFEKEYPT